jgi:hypothetical protein
MKQVIKTGLIVGVLAAIPLVGAAQTSSPTKVQSKPATKTAMSKSTTTATHATTGVVKSMSDTSLVISRPGKKGEETFVINSSTQKNGTVAVGSPVSVRYRTEGKDHVATAIMAQQTKKSPEHKMP